MTPSCISALSQVLRSGADFYIYRLPGESDFQFCTSAITSTERPDGPCFMVRTYDGRALYMSPGCSGKNVGGTTVRLPAATTRDSYARGFSIIHSWLTAHGGKTVLSRVMRTSAPADIPAYLNQLGRRNPDAYVFMFRTACNGLWLGASPELLLRADVDGTVSTVSLAGTRVAGQNGESDGWDRKNLEEQQMVTDFITDTLVESGYLPEISALTTHSAGAVEHLMTGIRAVPGPKAIPALELAMTLAPTPAVCGLPRTEACRLIAEAEDHVRGCYAGFSGPLRADGSMSLYVTIRCAMLEPPEAALYLGGGNTALSSLESEWKETESKSRWYFL